MSRTIDVEPLIFLLLRKTERHDMVLEHVKQKNLLFCILHNSKDAQEE